MSCEFAKPREQRAEKGLFVGIPDARLSTGCLKSNAATDRQPICLAFIDA